MKLTMVAVLAAVACAAGCAAQNERIQINQDVAFDDAPTGTLIKRRPVKDADGKVVAPERKMSADPSVIGTFDTK